MESVKVTSAAQVPQPLQRAAKSAFAVGANSVALNADRDSLLVQFKDADRYYFDPENVTMHALELLGAARTYGLVRPNLRPVIGTYEVELVGWLREPLIVRTVYSAGDVRVQIGVGRWHLSERRDTAAALRHALIDALAAYYDETIAPYSAP